MESWYQMCKLAQAQQAQDPSADVSGHVNKLKDLAIKFIMNSELVVKYLMNPTDETRHALAEAALDAAVKELAGGIPVLGRFVGKMPIGQIITKVPGMKLAYDTVGKFIFDSIRVGFIPDELSNQSALLKQWDLDDNIATMFEEKIDALVRTDPALAQSFIVIIMRLKDDANLLNAQKTLTGV